MARCIVCTGEYDSSAPGHLCARCGESNTSWHDWLEEERQRSCRESLSEFLKPVGYSPLWAPLAIGMLFGLVIGWALFRQVLVLWVVAAVGSALLASLFAFMSAFSDRFDWHSRARLRAATARSPHVGIGSVWRSARRLALGMVLLTLLLAAGGQVIGARGAVDSWLPRIPNEVAATLRMAVPLIAVVAYGLLIWNLASLPMEVALQVYSTGLADVVPEPLYLRPQLFVKIVKEEAARTLGCASSDLDWGEMRRTPGQGLKLVVERKLPPKEVEDLKGRMTTIPNSKAYEIDADHWGRVLSIREL